MWLAALGYFLMFFFFFAPPPTPISAHLLFTRCSPPRLGLRVFPQQPLPIAARTVIASQDQSGTEHERGGTAYHTYCCRIKGHPQRSGIIWEGGRGELNYTHIFFISFFLLFFWGGGDQPTRLAAVLTPTPHTARSGVSSQVRTGRV